MEDSFSGFVLTYISLKSSKLGQLLKMEEKNETDRTASYERVSIHLKVYALELKI